VTGFRRVEPRLPVADVRASIDFYCTHLGFSSDLATSEPAPDFAIVCRDNVCLQLVEQGAHHPAGPLTIWIDIADALAEFTNLGEAVEIEWGPEVYDYGRREFAVLDPDCHRIILSEAIDD